MPFLIIKRINRTRFGQIFYKYNIILYSLLYNILIDKYPIWVYNKIPDGGIIKRGEYYGEYKKMLLFTA